MNTKLETATFGGGCFWCTEAIFQEIKGVKTITSGYSGGTVPGKPTYKEICSGLTGHAEVVQITFDISSISFSEILVIFMTTQTRWRYRNTIPICDLLSQQKTTRNSKRSTETINDHL